MSIYPHAMLRFPLKLSYVPDEKCPSLHVPVGMQKIGCPQSDFMLRNCVLCSVNTPLLHTLFLSPLCPLLHLSISYFLSLSSFLSFPTFLSLSSLSPFCYLFPFSFLRCLSFLFSLTFFFPLHRLFPSYSTYRYFIYFFNPLTNKADRHKSRAPSN